MRTLRAALGLGVIAALAAVSDGAHATPVYSFTTIDVPGAGFTVAAGINNAGLIAGTFGNAGVPEGFIRAADGTITTFLINGAATNVTGINNFGQTVGYAGGLGFIRNADGTFITFTVPSFAQALGINDVGAVVGYTSSPTLGFLRDPGGSVTTISDPGSSSTVAQGINNLGQIVGNINGETQAFLRETDGTFLNFVFPGAVGQTAAFAINDLGDIGGFYDVSANHGFVEFADGTFVTVDDPSRGTVSQVLGLNDSEDLVGLFTDANGTTHGYLAVPVSEPSGLAILLTALCALGIRARLRPIRLKRKAPAVADAFLPVTP